MDAREKTIQYVHEEIAPAVQLKAYAWAFSKVWTSNMVKRILTLLERIEGYDWEDDAFTVSDSEEFGDLMDIFEAQISDDRSFEFFYLQVVDAARALQANIDATLENRVY